jgi:hypothetical protein
MPFHLNDHNLSQVEQLASDGLTIKEIGLMLDIDPHTMSSALADENSRLQRAYQKGILTTKHAVLKKEIHYAKNGSPMAVKNYFHVLKKQLGDGQI